MGRRRLRLAALVVTALAWGAAAPSARAGSRTAVFDLYAEPALRDDAGAVTLLLRRALDRPERPVVPVAALPLDAAGARVAFPLDRAPEVARELDAGWLVAGVVERDGPRVRAVVHVFDAAGAVVARVESAAPDGDLVGLTTPLAGGVATAVGVAPEPLPAVSVGQLRRFVRATLAWRAGRFAEAFAALDAADHVIALRVAPAREAARALWSDPAHPLEDRLRAALAAGTPNDVFGLATGDDPAARGARARAHVAVSDGAAADRELRGAGAHPWLVLARVGAARLRDDARARAAALRQLDLRAPAALALVSRLGPDELPAELEAAAITAAAALADDDPRLAAAIGLRAALADVARPGALALISVRELDDAEVVRLRPLVDRAVAAALPDARRLAAELAIRAGDLAAAGAALDAWDPDRADPRAARLRGWLALGAGDPRAAALELDRAGDAGERVAALLAAGEPGVAARAAAVLPADSVIARLAAADAALAARKPQAAVVELRAAEALAPTWTQIHRRLARALELLDDGAGAARATALAEALDAGSGAIARPIDLAGGARATPVADGAGAREVALGALVDRLRPLLAELPPIAGRPGRKVVVAPLGGGDARWWSPRVPRPEALRPALVEALEGAPWRLDVTAAARPVGPPLALDALAALAAAHGADAVVLYRVRADGGDARLDLVAWDRGAARAFEIAETVDGAALGLVAWNTSLLIVAGSALALLVVVALVLTLRGRGTIEVRIARDPAGTEEVFCVAVSRGATPPRIDDPAAWREAIRRAGHKAGPRAATLVPLTSRYRVPVGRWHVHLHGVYTRGGDLRVLDGTSREVTLRRGEAVTVPFDLVPTTAELRVTIHDEHRRGVALWIDDRADQKVLTDDDGTATLHVPVGEHVLHVEARGLTLDKPLAIATPRIERLELNLIRERRLAEVAGELQLGPAPAEAPEIAHAPVPERPSAAATAPLASAGPPSIRLGPSPQAATVAATPAAGTTLLGRYRVDAVLGQGAMGIVYKAWDHNLERAVAIKALGSDVRAFPEAMSFFLQEAKALAQLNHPNIVGVYDQTSAGAETYMIMELVDGRTLEDLLVEERPMPIARAAAMIDQLCAGLAYAHARRVIHRDIKPANVFVARDGTVKLGDFGLARVLRELAIRRTEIRGTPLYMAPEQITGTNVGHRADLYAVGCTFFELITGRPPFLDGDVMYHHIHTAPPAPSSLQPGVPAELDALILRCLAKDPEDRVESADALRTWLRSLALAA